MDYHSAEKYLLSLFDAEKSRTPVRYTERKFNRVKLLFSALGNPQDSIRCFHIAGTKGKGSTAVFLSHALAFLGFKVGMFTSPHFHSLRERICIVRAVSGEAALQRISPGAIARHVARLRSTAFRLEKKRIRISFFEAITALAFLFFKEKSVDYAVVETGLGGRFDATNVLRPACVILTTVDYDHTAQLGARLKDIAYQKAGIIKEGVPVISAPQRPSVLDVFAREARRKHAALEVLGEDARVAVTGRGPGRVRFDFSAPFLKLRHLSLPSYAVHQAYNSALALTALYRTLPSLRFRTQLLKEAFSRAVLPGRFQIISPDPLVIVDVAHNPVSIDALCRTLQKHFSRKRFMIVFGASCDKDIRGMARLIRKLNPKQVIATKAHTPRGMDPLRIREAFAGDCDFVYPESSGAFLKALSLYQKGDCLVVCGSFYLVAEAMRFFARR